MESNIRSLVEGFVSQIVAAVEADSIRRIQGAVSVALAGDVGAARGRKAAAVSAGPSTLTAAGSVRRRPKQLCPVPGCTGVAAPVFGMVCAQHKDLPKAKIKEFRAQRRAAKAR